MAGLISRGDFPSYTRFLSLVALLLAFALAGCSTAKRPAEKRSAPNWQSEELTESTTFTNPPPAPSLPPTPSPPTATSSNRVNSTPLGQKWISFETWSRDNGLGPIRQVAAKPARFTLSTPRGVLNLTAGNRVVEWDGMKIHLGYAPMVVAGELMVHTLDVQRNLSPAIKLPPAFRPPGRVVVIDPGHGGGNTGARSVYNGTFEKVYTLDWALRLVQLLAAQGWQVHLTRTNDAELTLPDRVAFADRCQADLFVSLHFNSAYPKQEEAGLETYCLTPTGLPSNLIREFDDNVSQRFPNNAYDLQNFQLAMVLHRALLSVNGAPDRGVRRARFMGVLRGQKRPAVLLEGGYLSNPQEARQIADPQHRQKLAEAVARALGAPGG